MLKVRLMLAELPVTCQRWVAGRAAPCSCQLQGVIDNNMSSRYALIAVWSSTSHLTKRRTY